MQQIPCGKTRALACRPIGLFGYNELTALEEVGGVHHETESFNGTLRGRVSKIRAVASFG